MPRTLSVLLATVSLLGVNECSTPATAPEELPSSESVELIAVVDGDTIRVNYHGENVRVRLIGIDAPERGREETPDECFAIEATNILEQLLAQSEIILHPDPTQGHNDKYGRLLRHVYADDQSAALALIEAGAAREYTYDLPYQGQADHQAAEKYARENTLGLWEACTN